MASSESLKEVSNRIKSTYLKWDHETSIETMRRDWDELFSPTDLEARTDDFSIGSIPCRWFTPSNDLELSIALYIHGGGFKLGSIDSHAQLMSDIACSGQCKVLGFNYKLMPEAKNPEPLEDCIRVYKWLIDQGYSGNEIIIAGDSAGGGLAASLLQVIRNSTSARQKPTFQTKLRVADLPEPSGLILLSAWLDMTLSGESYLTREKSDPVHQTKMLAILAKSYAGKDSDLSSPLLSPLFGDLNNHPSVLIQVGDCEVGLSDSIGYAKKITASGGHAELMVWPDMIHVFQMFSSELQEAKDAISEIGTFIKNRSHTLQSKP